MTTPAMMSDNPRIAAASRCWRSQITPIAEMSTIPTPLQMA